MKRILVIDNGTGAMDSIKDSLKRYSYTILKYQKFKAEHAQGFTHIILTGGDHWATKRKFSEEVKLIRNPPAPILGICLGMQIIGISFDSTLKKLGKEITNNHEISIVKKNSLFEGLPKKITVYQYHEYGFHMVGNDLTVLAQSPHCIEAVVHKTLPVWGVQFHPEVIHEGKREGRKIIRRFLSFR